MALAAGAFLVTACEEDGPISVVTNDGPEETGEERGWISLGVATPDGPVHVLHAWNDEIVVGGRFDAAGGSPAANVAIFDGEVFRSLGDGVDGPVFAAAVYAGDLVVGGSFATAGSAPAPNVARWDGSAWHAMDAGLDSTVTAFAVFAGELYAAGVFTGDTVSALPRLARFDGVSWSPVTTQAPDGPGLAMSVYDGRLILGGSFDSTGAFPAYHLACWDGSTLCDPGPEFRASDDVLALRAEGSGLYVAGRFTYVGSRSAMRVARWTGAGWSSLGAGLGGPVRALEFLGGAPVAGGAFTRSGNTSIARVARFRGGAWEGLDVGVDGQVDALLVHDGDLYVGGHFAHAGGRLSSHIARWRD